MDRCCVVAFLYPVRPNALFGVSQIIYLCLTRAGHYLHTCVLQEQDTTYSVALSVCNVDRNPNAYVEAIRLANIVRTFTRHSSVIQAPSNETLEKEKDDYVYCLRTTVALRRPATSY